MSRYTIRRVGPAYGTVRRDIDNLHKICFPEADYTPTLTGYWWLVYYQGEVVGFAGLHESTKYDKFGYLYRSGVHPDHRGKGIQKRLIKVREKTAKELGWIGMITDTTDTIYSANNLINSGYKLFQPTKPWGYKHTNYWVKWFEK